MRVTVRAKPGSRKESVTLATTADGTDIVVVRVRARAVDGAANEAVTAAVAAVLGLRSRAVSVAVGGRSRIKQLEVDADPDQVAASLDLLPRETVD